jgi:hypothetical protein
MKIPAVWMALAFAAGILGANHWPHTIALWGPATVGATLVGAISPGASIVRSRDLPGADLITDGQV